MHHNPDVVMMMSEVEDNGALSNPHPEIDGALARVVDLVRQLHARPGPVRTPTLARKRSCRLKALVEQVVRDAQGPVRVRDVCAAINGLGVEGIDKASVRKTLHDRSRGPDAPYRHLAWGLYEWAGEHATSSPAAKLLGAERSDMAQSTIGGRSE